MMNIVIFQNPSLRRESSELKDFDLHTSEGIFIFKVNKKTQIVQMLRYFSLIPAFNYHIVRARLLSKYSRRGADKVIIILT